MDTEVFAGNVFEKIEAEEEITGSYNRKIIFSEKKTYTCHQYLKSSDIASTAFKEHIFMN